MKKLTYDDIFDWVLCLLEENVELNEDEIKSRIENEKIELEKEEIVLYESIENSLILKAINEVKESMKKENECKKHGHRIEFEDDNTIICSHCGFYENVVSTNGRGY